MSFNVALVSIVLSNAVLPTMPLSLKKSSKLSCR